ncbi:NAD-dependent epimerase/dehydratase family protein [Streptacidiphilus anmyonensis]|uniref:NAD-dependent epimerase/dehydratase family protein n=1 Tax=Streptacidiphilus anmyonensis TaxID=405782 RepID=UPI0005A8DCDD|nr:NAD(P)-dependent oxidoreductase [Streptacidiphilus anmyonensis]
MRIVLLGGAGYLGSVAAQHLAQLGHHVTVVDGLIYLRDDDPHRLLPAGCIFAPADLRDPDALRRASQGADAVVHLGGLVGEPACAVDEPLAVELNYASPILAHEAATRAGVPHYVFFSSCSVYGSREGTVTEDTLANPLGIYARTKVLAERRLAAMTTADQHLTVLRLATVHGRSPRQRLDSVVNRMTAHALSTGRIPLNGGAQRRPLVHVGDVALVLARVLTTGKGQRTFNVGSDRENYTIADIATTVEQVVPGARIDRGPERDEADARDYRTSFARLADAFPDLVPATLEHGVREVAEAVATGQLGEPDLPEYDNYRGLIASRDTGRISVLGSPECKRLHDEYATTTWSTL